MCNVIGIFFLQVIAILVERLDISEFAMPKVANNKVDTPSINMHVRYPKEHTLVAFADSTFIKKSPSREGLLNINDANTELLFDTLNKCEKQFSATTMYHDYAISPYAISLANVKPRTTRVW